MSILVVVPCGAAKVWKKRPMAGPTRAKDVYVGAPFKVNREYAERFADTWVILSAKYGFIDPNFTIPADYNVSFNNADSEPITVAELRRQAAASGLTDFETVVCLGGSAYAGVVREVLHGSEAKILSPAAGLPIGIGMGTIRRAIDSNRPFE